MPSTTLPTPTPEELEDLIYFSRTGDLDSLKDLIVNLCTTHNCPPSVILASAIDIDEDGLGSQSSLLHYPAANGNTEMSAKDGARECAEWMLKNCDGLERGFGGESGREEDGAAGDEVMGGDEGEGVDGQAATAATNGDGNTLQET